MFEPAMDDTGFRGGEEELEKFYQEQEELQEAFKKYQLDAFEIEDKLMREGKLYARHDLISMDKQPFEMGYLAAKKKYDLNK